MSKPKTFGCLLCGKVFTADSEPKCGALINGKDHCTTLELEVAMSQLQPVKDVTP